MRATLAQLGNTPAGRRIAVLGSMKELGDFGAAFHAQLAEPLASANVDHAVLVGEEMEPLAQALGGVIAFDHVSDAASATDLIRHEIRAGDAVLVKGSNGIGLSRLVAALQEAKN